jgi:ectoine hydroxylase-related dioxygenase (phytanoyl-CoA dioxygenase family)
MVHSLRFDPMGSAAISDAAAAAVEAFLVDGVVVVENVFDSLLVEQLRGAFERRHRRYLTEYDHVDALTVGDRRYMVTVELRPPFADPAVYANPTLMTLLSDLLGDVRLQNFGVVVALPGAGAQHEHRDGPLLFGGLDLERGLPPHAITVAVPLVDLDEHTGTTRVWPGSHRTWNSSVGDRSSEDPIVDAGSALLWDYRLRHGGLPNRSSRPRPLLYLTYARPWFEDVPNYSKQEPLIMSARQRRRVPVECTSLFPRGTRALGRGSSIQALRSRLSWALPSQARTTKVPLTARESVNGAFVAAPHPGLVTMEVESEALACDPLGTLRVPLNSTATLVWASLDGKSTIGDIATDLARELGVSHDAVRADIVTAVGDFVARGIVLNAQSGDAQPAAPLASARSVPALPDESFTLGDAGQFTVDIGDEAVAVRSNDVELLELMRGALTPLLTNEAPGGKRLSLVVTPGRGRIPSMFYLHRGDELVFRCATRGRLLRAALAELDGFLTPLSDVARLNASALVGEGGTAVLVGGPFRESLALSGRWLAAKGWQMLDGPAAFVGRGDFRAVIASPRLQLDPVGRAAIDADSTVEPGEGVPEGSYEVTHILVTGNESDATKLSSPAQRLAGLFPLLADLGCPIDPTDLRWLHSMGKAVDVRWIHGADDRELLDALAQLGSAAPVLVEPLPS